MLTAFRNIPLMSQQKQPQSQQQNVSNNLEHTVIKSRWKLTHVLGKGAFGEVYLAKDLSENKLIAVKVESPFVKKPVLRLEISILQKLQRKSQSWFLN